MIADFKNKPEMAEEEVKVWGRIPGLKEVEKELLDTRRALFHMLKDIDKERQVSINASTAMLHMLKDLDKNREELKAAKARIEDYSKTLERKVEERTGELKKIHEQLVRSEKLFALGKLAGTVAHELRNPLGVIRNSVYFLRMKLGRTMEDEKVKKHLEILEEEVNISDRIITDILTFGRMKTPQLSKTDIAEIINESLAKTKVPKKIEVAIELDSGLPRIMADGTQLRQVFFNIILNAIQAMDRGGRLTIRSIEKDEFIGVAIIDTGEGIPRENLNKIFEPLFSTKAKGTGFGLSICQSIIENHKGTIKVESEVGKGTKFMVKLPIIKEGR